MDGGDTPRPSIQATFFRLGFALHRLGVSGLRFRLLSRFRTVGGEVIAKFIFRSDSRHQKQKGPMVEELNFEVEYGNKCSILFTLSPNVDKADYSGDGTYLSPSAMAFSISSFER